MMKFKIEHNTNNEEEYKAIMCIIKHYEILEKELTKAKGTKPNEANKE